jgi:hypothetical protein
MHPDLFGTWYSGASYKGFELAYFVNSFGDDCGAFVYKRVWNYTKRFSADYAIGAVYGYKGRLNRVKAMPLKGTFLVTGNINPVFGIGFDYKIFKKLSVNVEIAPLIIIYGLRYII